jgi:dihydroneopterin aldolase
MLTIHLHNLQFFSFHCFYEEERIMGNQFEVNADVNLEVPDNITTLRQTVNYTSIYHIISERMAQPTQLLETVAQELTLAIGRHDPKISRVKVTIRKSSPPIENFQGSVGVTHEREFKSLDTVNAT